MGLMGLPSSSKVSFSTLPPHTPIAMPALSPTMTQGNIAQWNMSEGAKVNEGDIIAEIETDKATMAFEVSVQCADTKPRPSVDCMYVMLSRPLFFRVIACICILPIGSSHLYDLI